MITPKAIANVSRIGELSTAPNSAPSTPRTSLLPSSALHPSQSIWSQTTSAPQLPVRPPLLRPCSSQSLPARSPETPNSTRNLGSLLPVSSLSAFPDVTRSISQGSMSMLSSAFSPMEASEASPGSLPVSSVAADQIQAVAADFEDWPATSESFARAIAKIQAIYAEAMRSSSAARDAAIKAQKAAEDKVEELQKLLAKEKQEREKETQAWSEERTELLTRRGALRLPPTAENRLISPSASGSQQNSSTSLTTSLLSSDQSVVLPKAAGHSGSNEGSLAASSVSVDRGSSPKRVEE
ncbi:unnamed protein product [Durusdinium trenchii]|uniref:Uncharacterized protein n=1 Tax=Durusdinium trenchii TaxID=1381693 RepID=A0ABP0R0K1_9DINO